MKYEQIMKSLSDRTRLRIMYLLLKAKTELCICEIVDALRLAHYNVSRHMKELKSAGLVKEKREGKFVFYSLCCAPDRFVNDLVKVICRIPEKDFDKDIKRMGKRISLRKNGRCVVGISGKCG